MNRFLHIIVNQNSRNSMNRFKTLLLEIPKYTNHYDIHLTNSLEQLDTLTYQLKRVIKPQDVIILVGGDGSLNHGITMLEKHQIDNPVGYIPSGSGNDYARTHGISTNMSDAIKHFFAVKEATALDILHATEGNKNYYAVNSLGIGIDGYVNQLVKEQSQNKGLGPIPYLKTLFTAFKNQKMFPITLKVDQGIFTFDKVQLVLFINNPYFGGGLKIYPGAQDRDAEMEVLVANDIVFKDLFQVIGRLVSGKSHLNHPKLHTFKTKSVSVFTEVTEYAQKDGEVFEQEGFALTFTTKKRLFWL